MTSYSIIGAGAIGTALAQQFSRKNIRVKIANTRGGESLSDLTATLGGSLTEGGLIGVFVGQQGFDLEAGVAQPGQYLGQRAGTTGAKIDQTT